MAVRTAVVGAGNIGSIHGGVYLKDSLAEFVGYCDIIPDKAQKLAERDGVKWWPSVAKMLAESRDNLDAVSICTAGEENGGDHDIPTMECLESGLHVLGEKPISNNIDHAREMVAAAKSQGVCYGINLNHRFVPPAAKAREWVDSGRVGTLLLANMTMWINNPNETSPWFHMRALHPHSLDVLRYFCGPVRKVHAFFNRAPRPDSEDGLRVCWSNVQVNLLFENGVVGHLTGSYDANPAHNLERCEVMGTEGRFVLDNCFEELTFYPRRSNELTVIKNSIMGGMTGFTQTFETRIHRWLEQLTENARPEQIEASGQDGLAVQEIIEAAIQSWQTDSVVELNAAI